MKASFLFFVLSIFLSSFPVSLFGQELKEISHEKYGFGFECIYDENFTVQSNENTLAVYKLIHGQASIWSMAGRYVKNDHSLCFYPAFGLPASGSYLIRYLGKEKLYKAKEKEMSLLPIALENIFPVANEIPENTLCFYVKFNQSMQPNPNAYLFVDLLDENMVKQKGVWRQRSFWFENNTILVLMLHPGRIKHGIAATQHLNKLLQKGHSCTLRLNAGLKSMSGLTYDRVFEKHYNTIEADKELPLSPELLNSTTLKEKGGLQVRFNEAMDIGLVYKHLYVENEQGEECEGKWQTDNGVHWSFIPENHWRKGKYYLVYSTKLSDLARNELLRLFEPSSIENFDKEEKLKLSFDIK